MGVASLFMPGAHGHRRGPLAERRAAVRDPAPDRARADPVWASTVRDYETLYVIMLLNAMVYMPTIALNNTISYRVLEQQGMNFIQKFPPIRVWGTIGFVFAMWFTDLSGVDADDRAALHQRGRRGVPRAVRLHDACLPAVRAARASARSSEALGLDAFVLFRRPQMVVFFLCAMMLGGALQITNAFGGDFLTDFNATLSRLVRRAAPDPAVLDLADVRDVLHPDDPVLPAALRHQGRHAGRDIRLGAALRAVRLRRPGPGTVDARAVDDRLRHGLRLLQHLRLDVREPRGEPAHPRERAGAVHDHDQRARRLPRHDGRGRGGRPLHRRTACATGRASGCRSPATRSCSGSCSRSCSATGTIRRRWPPLVSDVFRRRSPAPSG